MRLRDESTFLNLRLKLNVRATSSPGSFFPPGWTIVRCHVSFTTNQRDATRSLAPRTTNHVRFYPGNFICPARQLQIYPTLKLPVLKIP